MGGADDGTGLPVGVVLASRKLGPARVEVAGEHERRLEGPGLLAPAGVAFLLDVEGRRQAELEGDVAHDEADGILLILARGDDLVNVVLLLCAEGLAADGAAVFDLVVALVLAAVDHNAPDGAEVEGEVGGSGAGDRGVVRELLGVDAAEVVVAAGEDAGDAPLRDAAGDEVDALEVLDVAAVVRDVAVHQEEVEVVAEDGAATDRLLPEAVRVRDIDEVVARFGDKRAESELGDFLVAVVRVVGFALVELEEVDRVLAGSVESLNRHAGHVDELRRTQNAVRVVVVVLSVDLDPHRALGLHKDADEVLVLNGVDGGVCRHVGGFKSQFHAGCSKKK